VVLMAKRWEDIQPISGVAGTIVDMLDQHLIRGERVAT
jgi:ApbE superfamily uncharacterized protein (UPF0280 family)